MSSGGCWTLIASAISIIYSYISKLQAKMTVKEYAFVIPDDEESLENYDLFREKMEEREKDFKKCVFELLGRSNESQE